jgi:hypothetical protein
MPPLSPLRYFSTKHAQLDLAPFLVRSNGTMKKTSHYFELNHVNNWWLKNL